MLLAVDWSIGEVARAVGVDTPGSIIQASIWLVEHWRRYQADASPVRDGIAVATL